MKQCTDGSHDPFVMISAHGMRIDLRKGTITFPEFTGLGRTIEPPADHSEETEAGPKTPSP
ncbi:MULTISPECIES: hypothetical protein [unclassified Pseudomonas]|uniref:hypothetical protein n=1 Tax=unclassified Pseudomonas TaxID=196821 RepID=UPI00257FBBEC|nr:MULTISPECIES: hypothetical protein [unclassified Pseudomonas]